MKKIEKIAKWIRHKTPLQKAGFLWDRLRQMYRKILSFAYPEGLARNNNGTDLIYVDHCWTSLPEVYEKEVWPEVMRRLETASLFVDVGGHMGLYAVCGAKRMPAGGKVVVFEPQSENARFLHRTVQLNHVEDKVQIREAAVGEKIGMICISTGQSQATISESEGVPVKITTLDAEFLSERIDVLKIDVEGAEEKVLQGAEEILASKTRRPHSIFIEVHPYNWKIFKTTSDNLAQMLIKHGYQLRRLDGHLLKKIDFYGEILAEIRD